MKSTCLFYIAYFQIKVIFKNWAEPNSSVTFFIDQRQWVSLIHIISMFKQFILLNILTLLLISCKNNWSKNNLSSKRTIGSNLHIETYKIFSGGAYGGDMMTDYLTDSANFRFYVGTFDNAHEVYTYECKVDIIFITKISMQEERIPYNTKVVKKIIERKAIDLNFLRKQNKFN